MWEIPVRSLPKRHKAHWDPNKWEIHLHNRALDQNPHLGPRTNRRWQMAHCTADHRTQTHADATGWRIICHMTTRHATYGDTDSPLTLTTTGIRHDIDNRGPMGGASACRARAGRAPGIFFDPCPTGDPLGGALSAVCTHCNYLDV